MTRRFDVAQRWNADHPPGTEVTLCLPDGARHPDRTAGPAMQWGASAMVTLTHRRGMWDTGLLEPTETPQSQRQTARVS